MEVNRLTAGVHVLDERVQGGRQNRTGISATHVIQVDNLGHNPRTTVQDLLGKPRAVRDQYDSMCSQSARHRLIVDVGGDLYRNVGTFVLLVPEYNMQAVT